MNASNNLHFPYRQCENFTSHVKTNLVTLLEREQKKQKLDQAEGDVDCEDNEPAPDASESFSAIGTRKYFST